MNENMAPEVDPLSNYSINTFHNFEGYENLPYTENIGHTTYPYPIKLEQYQTSFNYYNHAPHTSEVKHNVPEITNSVPPNNVSNNEPTNQSINNTPTTNNETNTDVDIKPDITENINKRRIKKERSKYFSEKITEKDFPFYGCSVCNICFKSLHELDTHVTIHKDRITSYDLRIKNQIKKKKLKKEMKKNKKKQKNVVKLETDVDIEIKPEDGYIGSEKASDLINYTESDNQSSKENENGVINEKKNDNIATTDASTREPMNKQEIQNLQKIYKCFACQKQFTLSYYLKLHVRSHTDEKPYTCAECGQSFITASKLGRHNKRFHLAIRYQCRICYRYFSRFEFLTRHFDKKHPDDKLEGEPYDYNAILPYLKELEEQLREKSESEKSKPKTEDLWSSDWPNMGTSDNDFKENVVKDEEKVELRIEEVKVDMDDVDVKQEADFEEKSDDLDDFRDDLKDENASDSDYFPSNTCAAPPRSPSPPPPGDRLQCGECGKRVSSASYLRVHARTHSGERPYKCYVCGAGFITSSKMHRHVLTHPQCWDDDEVKTENLDIKLEPLKDGEAVDDKKKLKMKKALAKFSKKPRSSDKKKKLYQKRPHACEFCQKRFLHLETLQVHKKSHEGESIVYKCTFCLDEQQDEATLKAHEATHDGPKPYLCTICGKGYKKRETMIYHRKNHKPEKEYICDICTKSFNAQCKLQRHIVSHRADKFVLRYECPVCAHMFNTKYHVQMHLATHQKEGLIQEENRNEILAMVLQNARKIPKTPDAPSALTDIVPADERSRVCNICGEIFQHFYYLEEHLKSHGSKIAVEDNEKAKEKKHICKICNKGFKLHYYLKLHSFTHTKEKPFICQQCGKGFITKGKLKRHLETHTGLKKYQCHICYKFFTRPSYLRIHVRTIHGTQDYNFRLEKQYGLSSVPLMGHSA
ncbi:zinc finger protein 234-like [Vanessa atalanta]|uniref:zinc finger protein 234-like n=1 Tax=Vanessa atalanta TaxID=42275 RepID=UPI001FCD4C07|nr:zinc finger protein 234-like [Vanessa atalanta]XP_047542201.1 zinc finger protein 234-like [Vanessa atalanta]